MAGQAATLTMENPHSRSCFAALLALPLSIARPRPWSRRSPSSCVDRVTGILARPVYGLLGVAAGRIVDVLVNETEAWRAFRFRTPNGRGTVMLSAEGTGAAAESSPARPPR